MKYLILKTMLFNFFIFSSICLADTNSWHFIPADVSQLHSKDADVRIKYGTDPLQFGDLRLPKKSGMHPVAIVIHGGCWVSKFADLKNSAALSDALRDEGIATWNIEYRRIDNPGGGWPGTFQDVAAAVDILPSIAKKYSLDLSHVIIIGQSAGGHFALWVAARHNLPVSSILYKKNPLTVQGVISLGGVPDLSAFREQAKKICDVDAIGQLIGASSEKNYSKNYKEASPSELLPLGTKQILIYGEDEVSVPAKYGYDYKKIATSKGDDVSVITVKYAAHHEYNVPNSITWPVILDNVKALLYSSTHKPDLVR